MLASAAQGRSAATAVRRGPVPDRHVAEQTCARTGVTHRRIVAAVALSAATPSVLLLVEWLLDAIGGWALVRDVGPRPWWNVVLAVAVVAAVAPGGWIDRWRKRRAAAAGAAPSPARIELRIGAGAPAYSLARAAWVAWWTTYVAILLIPFLTNRWVSPFARTPGVRTGVEWAPALALLLAVGLAAFAAASRFGRGRLIATFPVVPLARGARADVHLGVSDGAPRIDRVRAILRAVRERPRGPFGWFRDVQVAWAAEARTEGDAHIGPEREVRVSFVVPADAPPTDLDAPEPVHWEVLVLGRLGAGEFAARFAVRVAVGTGLDP